MNRVYAKKTKDLEKDIKQLIKQLGINKEPEGSKLFIKINLSLDRDYPGTTTRPDFLEILIKELSKKYNVSAGDADSTSNSADLALKVTGTGQAIINAGGTPINLSKDKKTLIKNDKCRWLKHVWMPSSIINADCVISLALLKTHVFTTMTGTIKNMFGSLPGMKILYHPRLNEAIHDSLMITKPDYAIIDGRVGMEGRGPVEGTPVKTGMILGSDNLISCDSEAACIMGFKPELIKHLSICNQSIKGFDYKLIGHKIRQHYKPANKGIIDQLQELSLKNKALTYLCYKTPLFKAIKGTAKTLKDLGRWRRNK
ncbi:MAG: DUF362 domain-containing protein [Candidatus Nanoarchaeia archaeon]|jgi:uncharacterized protein (DUF362 family)